MREHGPITHANERDRGHWVLPLLPVTRFCYANIFKNTAAIAEVVTARGTGVRALVTPIERATRIVTGIFGTIEAGHLLTIVLRPALIHRRESTERNTTPLPRTYVVIVDTTKGNWLISRTLSD